MTFLLQTGSRSVWEEEIPAAGQEERGKMRRASRWLVLQRV